MNKKLEKLDNNNDGYFKLLDLFRKIDKNYTPPISSFNNLEDYCRKLIENAIIYVFLDKNKIIGLIAFYANNFVTKTAFISLIGLTKDMQNKGIGKLLLKCAVAGARELGMDNILLRVNKNNFKAFKFYENNRFKLVREINDDYLMQRRL